MADDTTSELLRLGAATLTESGARPLDPGLHATWAGAALAAPAVPVRCADGDNLAVHHAVATAPAGSALVVAADGGGDRLGWWGEVLTIAARSRGLTGLVIDTCVRDTAAIARLGFPVWARGVALPGAQKAVPGAVGQPVALRGALVEPGDWVVADADGVCIVPGGALAEVIAAGRAREAKEATMFEHLRGGATTVELLGLPQP